MANLLQPRQEILRCGYLSLVTIGRSQDCRDIIEVIAVEEDTELRHVRGPVNSSRCIGTVGIENRLESASDHRSHSILNNYFDSRP